MHGMAPTTTAKKNSLKKEKLFHPESRKADQLARKAHRKDKLNHIATSRTKKQQTLAGFYVFLSDFLPESGPLSLDDLHGVVKSWLARHDQDLKHEQSLRRKGRPKSAKEVRLEEVKLRESEEYRTGFEVIDLTNEVTTQLFRQWDKIEVAYPEMLRFVRISSADPAAAVISRPGRHTSLIHVQQSQSDDVQMTDVQPLSVLAEPPSRVSSTMMTMDHPL